jgi:hypothetical protein
LSGEETSEIPANRGNSGGHLTFGKIALLGAIVDATDDLSIPCDQVFFSKLLNSGARFLELVLTQLPYRVEAVVTDSDMMFTMQPDVKLPFSSRPRTALRSNGTAMYTAYWGLARRE